MKLYGFLFVALIACAGEGSLAQTSVLGFSTFSMGSEVAPGGQSVATFVVGQPLADHIQGLSTRVETGFINSILVASGMAITAVKPDSALVGVSLSLKFRLPPGLATVAESLYYRRGGERSFTAVPLVRSGDSIAVTIPAGAVTLRGIEYFIAFVSNTGYTRFPQSGVDTIRTRFVQFASPLALGARRYRMISVPADLNNIDKRSVLEDDLGAYDPTRWRFFRWEQDRYVEYPELAANFTPGTAFWLITHAGGGFDIENGRSVSSLSPATIVLDTGWNQIASPFAFPVDWGELISNVNVTPAYFFDGSQYQLDITVLNPWEGYFVENRSGQQVSVIVPPVEAQPGLPKFRALTEIDKSDFVLQLSAASTPAGLRDDHNYLGFKQGATPAEDRLDLSEPPPVGEYLRLSIVDRKAFAANFKPATQEGEFWKLIVVSSLPHQQITVQMVEHGVLPHGFKIFVLDEDAFAPLALQDGRFLLRTYEASSVRSLRLIIGTEAFAEAHSGGIPLVPLSYSLDQNYPNPFNPSTTIRYQLKKRSWVRLEVFNILGQRVRTLVNAEQLTGVRTVEWNGTNDSGVPVASGMYVYRLQAGEFIATRKALLLR
ncbi:MAG TPA: T9SS type A sorting domain-containing protein [Bacteroidota bacterium]|nr:T9SS type A sorting domain-containing protein [Bacteroidota bacterium]